jgi:Domain of unknown function (DUF2703)
MSAVSIAAADGPPMLGRVRIDFLFLDLTTCTRCLGADRSLESALEVVGDVLRASGVEVAVNKVLVESAEQARALRFLSSPTIRVDGQDIAFELRESACGSEACTDGCGTQTACRVWVHRGVEYTEPPVAMVVDAILRRVYGNAPAAGATRPASYELPENLARFFAGRAGSASSSQSPCCGDAVEAGCGCR